MGFCATSVGDRTSINDAKKSHWKGLHLSHSVAYDLGHENRTKQFVMDEKRDSIPRKVGSGL